MKYGTLLLKSMASGVIPLGILRWSPMPLRTLAFPKYASMCHWHCLDRHLTTCSSLMSWKYWNGFSREHRVMCAEKLLSHSLDTIAVRRIHQSVALQKQFEHDRHMQSTIYAVSSGFGKCGVAVIRISGPAASETIHRIVGLAKLPLARKAVLHTIRDPHTGAKIDRGLVLWFPGDGSFTGEDCCELHVHGGPAVITATLSALAKLPGHRHAEPGDFTKRAFQNGKLDLTKVEGLADLIHAETEAQRCQALRQMEGDLSRTYFEWRKTLLKCVANSEAFIDFSEDENLEDDIVDHVNSMVETLLSELRRHLSDSRRGERLRTGVRVAILGEPNVGKSSLLNAICGRPAAIVSPIAGTTRDVVESALDIGGYPVLLSDTAGLRKSTDVVEQEGVRRAKQRASESDLIVIVADACKAEHITLESREEGVKKLLQRHLGDLLSHANTTDDENPLLQRNPLADASAGEPPNVIIVLNKRDLIQSQEHLEVLMNLLGDGVVQHSVKSCVLSCLTGEGIDHFIEVLRREVEQLCGDPSVGNPSLTQQRHREHLMAVKNALYEYKNNQQNIVIATASLQTALWHIGKITGQVSSEEVLDVLFRDFCIGK